MRNNTNKTANMNVKISDEQVNDRKTISKKETMNMKKYQIWNKDGCGDYFKVAAYPSLKAAVAISYAEGVDGDEIIYLASGVADDGVRVFAIGTSNDDGSIICSLNGYAKQVAEGDTGDWLEEEWESIAESMEENVDYFIREEKFSVKAMRNNQVYMNEILCDKQLLSQAGFRPICDKYDIRVLDTVPYLEEKFNEIWENAENDDEAFERLSELHEEFGHIDDFRFAKTVVAHHRDGESVVVHNESIYDLMHEVYSKCTDDKVEIKMVE